jgi:thiol-disulfide isomerase/thioredoxin
VPSESISRRSATSVPAGLPDLQAADGHFTWINLWAAWCVPCKQEIPLLRTWERRLANTGFRLAFVSLDDDNRQLDEFLKNQPPEGIKSTFWLREGKEREAWLTAAKVEVDTELPAHLLVDGKGKIRCFIRGAVEPDDYARLQQIIAQ